MDSVPVQVAAQAIRDEYIELPGLSLTLEQTQRLYRLDALTCASVLAALVDLSFLERNVHGRYVRCDRTSGRVAPERQRGPRPIRRRAA